MMKCGICDCEDIETLERKFEPKVRRCLNCGAAKTKDGGWEQGSVGSNTR